MTTFLGNKNLSLHFQPNYFGMPVQTNKGPLISEYLDKMVRVIQSSFDHHGRVFAFRIDLRFSVGIFNPSFENNLVLEKFIASFKAKVKHNREKAKEKNTYAHDTTVHYVWARELSQHNTPHYHMAILLHNDAFCTLGQFEIGRNNLFNRLNEAWASALHCPVEDIFGLVEIPKNPFYLLRRDDPDSIRDFFYRASYLCKAETKYYGNGVHAFGASRV